MSDGGSMTRIGFAYSEDDDALVTNLPMNVSTDVRVDGDAIIGGDLTITGSLSVGGKVFSSDNTDIVYGLEIPDISTGGSRASIVPDQDIVIQRIKTSISSDNGAGNATVKYVLDGVTLDDASWIITIAGSSGPTSDTHTVVTLPAGVFYVPAGSYFELRVDNTSANAIPIECLIFARRS